MYVFIKLVCNHSPGWNYLFWSWMGFENIKTYKVNVGGRKNASVRKICKGLNKLQDIWNFN